MNNIQQEARNSLASCLNSALLRVSQHTIPELIMNTARQQNTHPNEAQVAARLAQCPWREADYNSRITGSTHSVTQDGNVFRCGCDSCPACLQGTILLGLRASKLK